MNTPSNENVKTPVSPVAPISPKEPTQAAKTPIVEVPSREKVGTEIPLTQPEKTKTPQDLPKKDAPKA